MMNDGSLAKKYKVAEVILVDSSKGAYCARFKKAGKTTITISQFETTDVGDPNPKEITVTFPVTILPNEITTKTVKLNAGDTFRLSSTEIDKLVNVEGLDVLLFNRNGRSEGYTPTEVSYNNTLTELGYDYIYYKRSSMSYVGGNRWVKYSEMPALVKAFEAGKTGYDPKVYGISFSAVPSTAKALKPGRGEYLIAEYLFCDGDLSCKVKVKVPYIIEEKEHSPVEKVTKATLIKSGKAETVCEYCGKVLKSEIIYAANNVTLSKISYTYDGKKKKPSVVVKDKKGKTISKSYYSVTYPTESRKIGEYSVKIKFNGRYSGSKTLKYEITPKATSVTKLTPDSKSFTVTWKKQSTEVTGYQIMYSTSKDFKSDKKAVSVNGSSNTQKTIKNLKANKKYYVCIRTYKTVGKNKIYSEWSKTYSVTTKK